METKVWRSISEMTVRLGLLEPQRWFPAGGSLFLKEKLREAVLHGSACPGEETYLPCGVCSAIRRLDLVVPDVSLRPSQRGKGRAEEERAKAWLVAFPLMSHQPDPGPRTTPAGAQAGEGRLSCVCPRT